MKISIGTKITVVQPNGSQDPLRCIEQLKYYSPVISHELEVASEAYTSNGHSCFDVVGDSGTSNHGQTPNTRKTFFEDIGVGVTTDKKHLECGGITKAFLDTKEAEQYIEELLNEKNRFYCYSIALEMWGMNNDKNQVDYFMEKNLKLKDEK